MNEQRISVFMPSEDGEYIPIKFTSPEQDMKEDAVVIFLDEDNKSIFIWTGASSPVRKRFISSQIARQMRLEKGLTHRISTEDQGNETERFWDFIDRLRGVEIQAKTLLEVSPPPGASDLPLPQASEAPTKKVDRRKVETMKKIAKPKPPMSTMKENIRKEAAAPPPPTSTSIEKTIKLKPVMQNYYCVDQTTEVLISKAKLLVQSSDQNRHVDLIHISTAATEGKISFFSVPQTSKVLSCKTEKPILVLYIKPDTESIMELDDLKIPLPAGNSIYYSCPGKTFISLNIML